MEENSRDASGQRELQQKEVLHHERCNRKRRGKRGLKQIANINGRGEGHLLNEKFCNNSQSSETNFHRSTAACLKDSWISIWTFLYFHTFYNHLIYIT